MLVSSQTLHYLSIGDTYHWKFGQAEPCTANGVSPTAKTRVFTRHLTVRSLNNHSAQDSTSEQRPPIEREATSTMHRHTRSITLVSPASNYVIVTAKSALEGQRSRVQWRVQWRAVHPGS